MQYPYHYDLIELKKMVLKFVGRKEQIDRYKTLLRSKSGELILVTGRPGIGKSALLDEFQKIVEGKKDIIFIVRIEISDYQNPNDYFLIIINKMKDLFWSRCIPSYEGDLTKLKDLTKGIFELFQIKGIGSIIGSVINDTAESPNERFVNALMAISQILVGEQRLVIIIDPRNDLLNEKHLAEFLTISKRIPNKIKIIIAQRLEDILRSSPYLNYEEIGPINYLSKEETIKTLRETYLDFHLDDNLIDRIWSIYAGDPFALASLIRLLKGSSNLKQDIEQIPPKIEEIMKSLYCDIQKSKDALKIVKILSFVSDGVDECFLAASSCLTSEKVKSIIKQANVERILDEKLIDENRRIPSKRAPDACYQYRLYHPLFIRYVRDRIDRDEYSDYQEAVKRGYRKLFENLEKNCSQDQLFVHKVLTLFEELLSLGDIEYVKKLLEKAEIICRELNIPDLLKSDIFSNYNALKFKKNLDERPFFENVGKSIEKSQSLDEIARNICRIGIVYYEQNNFDQALLNYQKSLQIFQEKNDQIGIAILLICEGMLFQSILQYDDAKNFFDKALEIGKKQKNYMIIVISLIHIGEVCLNTADYNASESSFYKVIDHAIKNNDKRTIAIAYHYLGRLQRVMGQFDNSIENLSLSKTIFFEINDIQNAIRVMMDIGDEKVFIEKYDEAVEIFKEVVINSIKIGDLNKQASASLNIANAYFHKNDYSNSMLYYRNALKIYENLGDKQGIALIKGDIGKIFFELKDYQEAEIYTLEALELSERINDKEVEALQLRNLGVLYMSTKKNEKSIMYLEKSIKIYELLGKTVDIAFIYDLIGRVYESEKQYQLAIEKYTLSLNKYQEFGDKQGEVHQICSIGDVLIKQNKLEEAIEKYEQSIKILKEVQNSTEENKLLLILWAVLIQLNDSRSSIYLQRVEENYEKACNDEKEKINGFIQLVFQGLSCT